MMLNDCPLPKIPSQLIRLAIDDLEKVEKSSDYWVYMGMWHQTPPGMTKCYVCLAGAVMAETCGVPRYETFAPSHFEAEGQLRALDEFRMGNIKGGFDYLKLNIPDGLDVDSYSIYTIVPYDVSPDRFKQEMRALAEFLERHEC